jgi:hypothetical protein
MILITGTGPGVGVLRMQHPHAPFVERDVRVADQRLVATAVAFALRAKLHLLDGCISEKP